MLKNSYKSPNSKEYLLIKDTIIFGIGYFSSKFVLFLLVPLYTNYLSADEYGVAELIITMSQLLIPLLSANIFSSVLRFGLSKEYKQEDVLVNAFVFLFVSIVLCFFIRPLLNKFVSIAEWKDFLIIYSIANIINSIEFNYLKVKDRNVSYAILNTFQTFLLALLSYILIVSFRWGVRGYLYANVIACCLISVATFVLNRFYKCIITGKFDRILLEKMLVFSAPLILNDISWWFIHSSDKIMIEQMVDTKSLGMYTLAGKIPSLMNAIIVVFSQAWGISSIKEFENSENVGDFYSRIFKYYFIIVGGVSIALIGISKDFINIYVGQNFRSSWRYMPILIASASFSAISAYCGSIYAALKKTKNSMLTTVFAGILNILLNFFLILKFNIWGALIATYISYSVMAIIRLFDVKRLVGLNYVPIRFYLSFILIGFQAVIASCGYNSFMFGMIALFLFILLNRAEFLSLTHMIIRRFSR